MNPETETGSSVQMQRDARGISQHPKYPEDIDDFPPHQHTDRMIRAIKRERTEE